MDQLPSRPEAVIVGAGAAGIAAGRALQAWGVPDTKVNWRVEGGYGALIAGLADGLPIRRGCRVSRIDASARAIRVETDRGLVTARNVIVTVPTGLLASGAIRFDTPLDAYREAAAGLPLGLADKVYFELDGAEAFAPDTRLLGGVETVDGGSYTLRPRGRPLVEGYLAATMRDGWRRAASPPSPMRRARRSAWRSVTTSAASCARSSPPPGRRTGTRSAPVRTPCRATPTPAPDCARPTRTVSSSPASDLAAFLLDRAWRVGGGGSGRRRRLCRPLALASAFMQIEAKRQTDEPVWRAEMTNASIDPPQPSSWSHPKPRDESRRRAGGARGPTTRTHQNLDHPHALRSCGDPFQLKG